jgi:hypothetical protein
MTALAVIAVATVGCKAVEPAPEDLDGLFHWFWTNYEEAGDDDWLDGINNAHAAMGMGVLEDVVDGGLGQFTREQMDLVDMRDDADPSELAGLYLLNVLPCTLEQIQDIVTSLDQMTMYDEAYESYEREYTSDEEAYFSGDAPTLSFRSVIGATMLGASYTETVEGLIRRVPTDDDFNYSPVILARYHMPEEAVWDTASFFFTQDYQVEIYYERSPGQVAHLYGLWRHMGYGQGSTQDEGIARQVLNGLSDWDQRTAELCVNGL